MLTLSIGASFSIAYSSWQFNKADNSSELANVGITDWTFVPIDEGNTIIVDENGNVTVKDEDGNVLPVEAEVTYPDGTTVDTNGGTIEIDIGANEDGDLVVTDYVATDLNGDSIFGGSSSIAFPETIVINGVEYPVVAINTPVTISANNGSLWQGSTCSVTIPEGYVYICDEAFQNVNASGGFLSGNTTFTYSLPASLEYLGYHAIKMNVSGGSVVVNYAGTKAQFQALASASASAYTGGGAYCFFTANNNNTCTVTCSDGTLTCRQNGTIS